MQPNHWLPLTEYAHRSGMSISTLRRKIKANAIDYKMDEGRYLIKWDEEEGGVAPNVAFHSSDTIDEDGEEFEDGYTTQHAAGSSALGNSFEVPEEVLQLRREMQSIRDDAGLMNEENSLRWRALEARVTGLAKKLDLFTEQFAELKMLVKLFEEKLDNRG
jgi:hypothetical protein